MSGAQWHRRSPVNHLSFGNVPLNPNCQLGPFALQLLSPDEHHRSPLQVIEAEPSPGVGEKEQLRQRLERLQQAVAELEVDRSKLQCHNAQLRTTLEQVSNFHRLPLGPRGPVSPFLLLFLNHFY